MEEIKRKRGRPRKVSIDEPIVLVEEKKIPNRANRKAQVHYLSPNQYYSEALENATKSMTKLDEELSSSFSKFRNDRLETGIDYSKELFDKEIDKWPMS